MREIGLWGWFGYRNCGDDLLLINTVEEILSCGADDLNITVFGNDDNINKLFPSGSVNTQKRSASGLIKYAFKADVLVIGPGGIFPQRI